jgi:hypothetical protein
MGGGHVALMGEMTNAYKIFVGKPEGKNHLDDLVVDGRILKWILWKQDLECGLDSCGSRWDR